MIAHRDPTATVLQGWFPGSGESPILRFATDSAPSQTLLIGSGGPCRVDTPLPLRGQRRLSPASQFSRLFGAGTFSTSMLARISTRANRNVHACRLRACGGRFSGRSRMNLITPSNAAATFDRQLQPLAFFAGDWICAGKFAKGGKLIPTFPAPATSHHRVGWMNASCGPTRRQLSDPRTVSCSSARVRASRGPCRPLPDRHRAHQEPGSRYPR